MFVSDRSFWRWYFIFVAILSVWYLYIWRNNTGTWFSLVKASFLLAVFLIFFDKNINLERFLYHQYPVPDFVIHLTSVLLISIPTVLSFFYPTQIVFHQSGKLLLLFWTAGVATWLMQSANRKKLASQNFFLVFLSGGVLYKLVLFIPEIQTAPFSLGWSEGSRFYNASLFFSPIVYREIFALPVLHPTRYLLQSIPFLTGSNLIILHRFWQVLLWVGLVGLGSFSLVKRLNFANKIHALIYGLWVFLFFFQGAVYYHLIVCVILVFLGYNQKHPWRTLVFVVIASVWAGLSRVNWIPVPALLAVTIYLLETPVKRENLLRYLRFPILWCLTGGISAIIINRFYALLSGNALGQFSSSFSSYMIWSRLLPNTTYSPGIILGLLIVVLPLLLLVFQQIKFNGVRNYFQWIRTFGLAGILILFGLGGIVVSVKIGGGGDLHNLDAFLVFWVVIAMFIILNRFRFETDIQQNPPPLNFGFVLFAVIVPIALVFQQKANWNFRNVNLQYNDVFQLQQAMDIIDEYPGDVLFISERQLLTFRIIQNVKLIPDYEKVFLMEMVMSNNQPYLEEFHRKLANHEFSAIVSDSVSTKTQDIKDSFWIENNLWVDKVVYPLLDYYEPVYSLQENTIVLLIPRDQVELYDRLSRIKSK